MGIQASMIYRPVITDAHIDNALRIAQTKKINTGEYALIIGGVAFMAAFGVIYKEMGGAGNGIFNMVAVVWGLYSVAYMLPNVQKNLMYNVLDLISKNFFAIMLTNEIKKHNMT